MFSHLDVGTKPEKMVIIGTDNGCAIFFRYEGINLSFLSLKIILNLIICRQLRSLSMGHKQLIPAVKFQGSLSKRLVSVGYSRCC